MAGRGLTPVLSLAVFVNMLLALIVSPFLPAIALDLDVDPALVGQVPAAVTLLATVLGLVAGPLAERHTSRVVLEAGLLSVLISSLATGLAPAYSAFLGLALVGALGRATVLPVAQAIGSTAFPEEGARRRALAWTSAGVPLASIVGVPLLAYVGGISSWRVAFATIAGLAVVAILLVRRAVPRDAPMSPGTDSLRETLAACWRLLREPLILRLIGSSFASNVGIWSIVTYLGLFYVERYGFPLQDVAWVFLVGGAALFLGSVLARYALQWGPPVGVLLASRVLGGVLPALGLIVELPASGAVALLAAGLLVLGMSGVVTVDLLAVSAPTRKATAMTANGSALNLGAALGAALGGLALSQGGFVALGLCSLTFGLLAAGLVVGARAGQAGAAA